MTSETVTIPLSQPITRGGTTITELVVRRPRTRDLRQLPADIKSATLGVLLDLGARLCSQPPSVIDELDPADSMRLLEVVGDFLPASPGTGA